MMLDVIRARWIISATAVLSALLGVAAGLLTAPKYEATALLAPVLNEGGNLSGGLGALASQYSGLASLAGLSVGGGTRREEAVAVLQSQLLTERYIQSAGLLPILFASKWDTKAGKWKVDDPKLQPTLWLANRLFRTSIRQVTSDAKTGLVVLTIRWTDPVLATRWANDLVHLTNEYMRDKAIAESRRNINYLKEQVEVAGTLDARRTIYSMLEEEVNKEMVAKGREEFALKTIDPAFVPQRPASLGPITLGILGFLGGALVAVMWLLIRRVVAA